jgi:hypothetical protein
VGSHRRRAVAEDHAALTGADKRHLNFSATSVTCLEIKEVPVRKLQSLFLLVAGLCGSAQALVVVDAASFASVQVVASDSTLTQDLQPGTWSASANVGSSIASVAADLGIGRSIASTLGPDAGTRSAGASVEWYIELRNDTTAPVALDAGAFVATWEFQLSKVESSVPSARFSATANGSFSFGVPGPSVAYRHFDETASPAAFVLGSGLRNGLGTFEILAATESGFAARAGSAPIVLDPGAGARATVSFFTSVVAGPGWAGTMDASRSVKLHLTLPAGVTLESPQPLGFVTAVPEPATAWLAALGLATVLAGVRSRKRAPPSPTRTPSSR